MIQSFLENMVNFILNVSISARLYWLIVLILLISIIVMTAVLDMLWPRGNMHIVKGHNNNSIYVDSTATYSDHDGIYSGICCMNNGKINKKKSIYVKPNGKIHLDGKVYQSMS